MKQIIGIAFIVVFFDLVCQSEAACPVSWKENNGTCYLITTIRNRFTDEEIVCSSRNATMYVFHDDQEWDWLRKQLVEGPRIEYYIGLQRVNKTWTWIDGTPYDKNSTHWYRNQVGTRDDARHRCATMYGYLPYQGQVHQQDCYGGWGTICTKPNDAYELCNTEDGWTLMENQCIKFFEDKATWFDANQTCTKNEAHLLRPITRREVMAIGDIIPCGTQDNQIWVDITDVPYPGRFVYSDNSTLRYQFWWSYGRTIISKGNTCVYATPLGTYYWMSELCTEEKKFMCSKPTGTCPPGWAQLDNECFQLVSVPTLQDTWFGAKQFCENQNAELLIIKNPTEEGFVQNMMVSQQVQSVWLGFSDTAQPDVLSWLDSTAVSNQYTHWDLTYPRFTRNRTDCGKLNAGVVASAWSNGYCFVSLPFVCKATISSDVKQKPTPAPTMHCDPGWLLYNGNCYSFGVSQNTSGYSWNQARRFCFSENADLTTIKDANEQAFIMGNVLDASSSWIGLHYSTVYNKLQWVDQTDPKFLNFFPGEPDDLGSGEDCMQIVGGRQDFTGAWDDGNCSVQQDFICKKKAYPGAANLTATIPPTTLGSFSYRCGPQWIFNSLDGFCYQVVLYHPKTFSDSQWACQQMGGSLASITGPREQRYLQAILNTGTYLKVASNYWIGGSDASQEGGWTWIDGSPFAYLNWHPGEPNDRVLAPSGEDCIEIVPAWNYQWNDKRCDKEQNYICKKPALPMTTTVMTPTSGQVFTCGNEPLISGNYSLLDGDQALTASSSRDSSHGPYNSRLYQTFGGMGPKGWSPATKNAGEYLQAYFYNLVTFKGVMTAGNPVSSEWVTSYQIRYQYDYYSEWVWYEEPPGTIKQFPGNVDNQASVTNVIQFPFQAKYIRLYPIKWNNAASIRWELLGCVEEFCLADYAVSGPLVALDSAITASSSADSQHQPTAARLHPLTPQTPLSSWKPNPTDRNPYIQVDIGSIQIIRGVTIAGNPNAQEWVARFRVMYGTTADLVSTYYQEPYQTVKVFDGNVNNNETVTRYFKGHFQARFIKIEPVGNVGAFAMRFDVMVCPHGCSQRALISGGNGKVGINDDQLSASTSKDNTRGPAQGRLNKPALGNTGGAWEPMYNDQRQWIQADLEAMIQITALATQGRAGHDEWVSQYKMAYSQDGQNFVMYSAFQRDAILFTGNFDDSTPRKHYLTLPVIARYIRIYPINYHKSIALRWEVYGCPGPDSGTQIGCYADDSSNRDLPFEPFGDPNVGMWPPMCIHHCFSRGYYYAGLQNRYLCFCGNSYGRYGSSQNCNQPCYSKTRFNCGGINSNSIYSTGLTPVTKVCPHNWKAYNDKCYLLLFNMTTWATARQDCHMMGGDLATVNSQAEQDLVYTIMSNKGASDVWIGLNDIQESNFFEWINGEVTMYTNWNVNQPANTNSVNENCVMINKTDGGWQDQNCNEQHQYLCMTAKKGSSQPPQPTQSPGCDIGWTGFRWACYLFMDQPRTFIQARQACKARGASLVHISDRYDQAFLSSSISTKTASLYWTNIADLSQPGTYIDFDTNTEVDYTNWAPNRPGNGRSCVAMQTKTPAGFWIDTNCTTLAGAICQKLGQGQTTPKPPTTTPAPIPCPVNWIEINNYCYQINNVSSNHQLPYADADKDCKSQGAALASFHNSSDFNTLWRNQLIGTSGNYWIGINALTILNSRREYTWTDRTPVNYVNWAPNQPDNYKGREDCGEVWTGNGLWNDQVCGLRRNWICKVHKGANVHSRMINHAPTAGPPGTCQNLLNWASYNNHCYFVVDGAGNQAKTWREARQWCQTQGADLVSIGTMLEQLFVQSLAANISSYSLWTGFTELDYMYGYRWSDGSVPSYINWNQGEPNDYAGAEDCVEMRVYNGKWNDAHCAEKKGFVCEATLGGPAPTTPAPLLQGYCPVGFSAHRNKCYKIFTTPLTWTDAHRACTGLGGFNIKGYNLASISNDQENAFVTTLLKGIAGPSWIGLQERYDHRFQWVDNEDLTYTNWDRGEPNGARDVLSCGRIYSNSHNAGLWDDVPCNIKQSYICETNKKTSITTPEMIPTPCPTGYVYYQSDCFLYVPTMATWQAADADCKSKNSFLATISDPFEQSFVYLMINDKSTSPNASVWIGLNDVTNTQTYQWTQPGWTVRYTNWDNGQPKRATGGGCVSATTNGHWSDTPCTTQLPYICKNTTATPPATPRGPNGQCPINWISYGSKCYRFIYTKKLSFLDATLDCNRYQSSVVSVHSMDDNIFLLNTLKSYTIQSEGLWLGFHKSPFSGFEWYDKSTPQFINWDKGEPSGQSQRGNQENCVEMRSWNGAWNDLDCSSLRGYICEKPQNVDVVDNTTPGPQQPQSSVNAPTKVPTSVPNIISPSLPNKASTARPTAITPAPTNNKPSVITNTPLVTIPKIPNYTGSQPQQQGSKQTKTFIGLSTGGLIGVIIAIIIALAIPSVGLILWKKRRSNIQMESIGFENSTYQYDTKDQSGQFVADKTESDS